MRHALYFLLLFVSTFSAHAQFAKENQNSLINVRFYSVDATNPNEPPREWLSLPDSVKIFANDKPLILYKNYILGGTAIAAVEKKFLNATFKFILPDNKTVFKATAKRKIFRSVEPITGFFGREKYLNSKGEEIEKVIINKPLRISTNGEGVAISATLKKDEKILYLVDNKVVEESFIAKIDEEFMKKVFQMNADDSDLIAKFGERAKGFDNVFCIWTTDLTNKK
jgi:hypothetical protein